MNTPITGHLTSKDIATLANVTRAAVGNWRSRHEDFPQPIPDSPARRPLFSMQEVISWLEVKGLLPPDAEQKKTEINLAAALNLLRASHLSPTDSVVLVLYLLALRKSSETHRAPEIWDAIVSGSTPRHVIQAVEKAATLDEVPGHADFSFMKDSLFLRVGHLIVDLVAALDAVDIDDYEAAARQVIDSFLGLGGRGADSVFGTSNSASSTLLVNAAATTASEGDTLFDPACGIGGTLRELSERIDDLIVIGNDTFSSAVTIAQLRVYLEDGHATFTSVDSLRNDAHGDLLAQTIVVETPTGRLSSEPKSVSVMLSEAGIGVPLPLFAEEAFLAYVITHLASNGYGYVLTSTITGSRKQSTQFRQALVACGAIEAVIHLPAKLLAYSNVQTLLWVVRNPQENPDASVLVADASTAPSPETQISQWLMEMRTGRETSIPSARISLAELITNNGVLTPNKLVGQQFGMTAARTDLERSLTELQSVITRIHKERFDHKDFVTSIPVSASETTLQHLLDEHVITRHDGSHDPKKDAVTDGVDARLWPREDTGAEPHVVRAEHSSRWLQDGDVLVPTDTYAPARVFSDDGIRWVAPVGMAVVKITDSDLTPEYLAACINASPTEPAAREVNNAPRDFARIRVPRLDVVSQRRVTEALEKLERLEHSAQDLMHQVRATRSATMATVHHGMGS